jgi:hypothetical protein
VHIVTLRTGPSYREWIDVIEHSKLASFEELRAMAERIESSDVSPLTEGQRADLLERLGDLQVAASQRQGLTDKHDLRSGPAMS